MRVPVSGYICLGVKFVINKNVKWPGRGGNGEVQLKGHQVTIKQDEWAIEHNAYTNNNVS